MAPSILRKKETSQKAAKLNVSFSKGVSVNSKKLVQSSNDTSILHDGDNEEDALDPTKDQLVDGEDNWREREERQIREAKSARETRRVVDSDLCKTLDEDCRAMYSDRGERLPGEEEVDKHLSLVHDYDKDNVENSDKVQCPIEPFNLTSEREDGAGYFEGDTYVFRKHQNEGEEDAWLDNLKSDGGESIPNTASKNNNPPSGGYMIKRQKKDDCGSNSDHLDKTMTKEQIYEQYIPLLATDAETVIQALGRYGTIIKMEKKAN